MDSTYDYPGGEILLFFKVFRRIVTTPLSFFFNKKTTDICIFTFVEYTSMDYVMKTHTQTYVLILS